MASLKKQTTNSVIWSAIERFSVQGIQYILTIILARLLMPEHYGLIAMLSIFLAVAQTFIDGGFANALIQKKECSSVDYSTAFYFNIAVAAFFYLILFMASPAIASFYNEPLLNSVTKVAGITLVINSFGIIQQAKLTRELNFKSQAIASLIAVVCSGSVGVALAYSGYGVWALVWHTLLNNLLRVSLLPLFSKWQPLTKFSVQSFKELFGFGSKLLLAGMMHTIYTNLYTLIIGKKFAATELGYFNRASTLAQFPSSNFTNVIVKAIYPIQCKMQDDDEQLKRIFLIYLRIACYIIFPVMIGLCVLAEPLIRLLLTDKWLPAVPMFQILCIAYMWDPVMKINSNIVDVKGRSDYHLKAEFIKKSVAILILGATLPFGVMAMCGGLILYALADVAIIAYYSRKLTHISLIKQASELLPVTALSVAMGGVCYVGMLVSSNPLIQLLVGGGAGVAFFFGASIIGKLPELNHLLTLIKSRGQ